MSYTSAYALWPGERHEEIAELRNSHGSAPVVWGKMFARYVDGSGPYPESSYMFRTEELWPLYKRQDIPAPLRRVLLMTYDNAVVSRENYARAAADIRDFLTAFHFDPAYVNHWPAIAALFESNPDCPAIGFRWTSVCENPFEAHGMRKTKTTTHRTGRFTGRCTRTPMHQTPSVVTIPAKPLESHI